MDVGLIMAGVGHVDAFLQRFLLLGPGMQATIEIGIVLVTQYVQGPDQATGPTTALVVVGHHMGVRCQSQGGEQFRQGGFRWQFAGPGHLSAHELHKGQVDSAGNMGGGILLWSAQVHQE